MVDTFNPKLLAALNEGRTIVYAPISGGLVLLDHDQKGYDDKEAQPTMLEFVQLRQSGKIEYRGAMSQGHHIFHGLVNFYQKPDEIPTLQ